MPRRNYSSTAIRTTLSAPITDVATSLVVADATGYPSTPFTIIVDADTVAEEVMTVTAKASTTFTVTRAVEGTAAIAHSAGGTVQHGVSARDFDEPNAFLNTGGTVTGNVIVDGTVTASDDVAVAAEDGATARKGVKVKNTGGVNGSELALGHARGTISSPTQSLDNDVLGKIAIQGTSNTGAVVEPFTIQTVAWKDLNDLPSIGADTTMEVAGTDAWLNLKSSGLRGYVALAANGTEGEVALSAQGTDGSVAIYTSAGVTRFYGTGEVGGETGTSFGRGIVFTPTISGTGWALGNATHDCSFMQHGFLSWLRIRITWGSTSTYGTGGLTIGGFPTGSSDIAVGSALYSDAGTLYPGTCSLSSSTLTMRSIASPLTAVINTVPFTWVTGDILYASVMYENQNSGW